MDENGHPRNGVVVALRKASEPPTQDDWTGFLNYTRDARRDEGLTPPSPADDAAFLGHLRSYEGAEATGTSRRHVLPDLEPPTTDDANPCECGRLMVIGSVATLMAFVIGHLVTTRLFPLIGGW